MIILLLTKSKSTVIPDGIVNDAPSTVKSPPNVVSTAIVFVVISVLGSMLSGTPSPSVSMTETPTTCDEVGVIGGELVGVCAPSIVPVTEFEVGVMGSESVGVCAPSFTPMTEFEVGVMGSELVGIRGGKRG